MTGRRAGILLAFATACISGVAIWVNAHAVTHFTDATVYTTAKNAIAGALLVVLAVSWPSRRLASATQGSGTGVARGRRIAALAAVAVIGGSVPFVLFFEGIKRVGLSDTAQASFIQKTLVIWVALLAVPLLKERVRVPHLLAIALLVLGQAYLLGVTRHVPVGTGEAMILGATLLWSAEVILVKKLLAGIAPRTLAAARMGLGTTLLFVWLAITGKFTALGSYDSTQWRWVVLSGLLLCGYVATWYAALSLTPAVDVTAVLVFGAGITAALSGAFDGKSVSALGATLVVAGTLLAGALALRRKPDEVVGT
jgi:drug/metabolite transporter (DMT)-like permease